MGHVRSSVPNPWKHEVLTTEPPRKFHHNVLFMSDQFHLIKHLSSLRAHLVIQASMFLHLSVVWSFYCCMYSLYEFSVQFSSVAQSCLTLCNSMNHSTPGLPVHHHLPGFTQTHVHRVGDAMQPSHPLSSPSPPAPNPSQHQSLFQ